jgi:hypothetical protein
MLIPTSALPDDAAEDRGRRTSVNGGQSGWGALGAHFVQIRMLPQGTTSASARPGNRRNCDGTEASV